MNDPLHPQTDPANVQSAEAEPARDADAARPSEDELRQAYLQGAREALAQERDSNHSGRASADSADHPRARAEEALPRRARTEDVSDPPEEDNSPIAVFIFKDGHKLETKNFAIMGTTLYDLSSGSVRKVQLTDLDKDATLKANDDRGIQVKIP